MAKMRMEECCDVYIIRDRESGEGFYIIYAAPNGRDALSEVFPGINWEYGEAAPSTSPMIGA